MTRFGRGSFTGGRAEHALACASHEGAYLSFEEHLKGTLEVGKHADIAVLDQDLLTVSADAIPGIHADMVIVGGSVVLEPPSGSV